MHAKLLVNGIKPGARPSRCEKNEGDTAEGKDYESGRCFVAAERVPAGVATAVIKHLVVDHLAEHRTGCAACCAADDACDHGTCDGTEHSTSRSGEHTDRCATFCAG